MVIGLFKNVSPTGKPEGLLVGLFSTIMEALQACIKAFQVNHR